MKVGDKVKITGNESKAIYEGELVEWGHFFNIGEVCVVKEIYEGGTARLKGLGEGGSRGLMQNVSVNDFEIIEDDCLCCDSNVVGVAIEDIEKGSVVEVDFSEGTVKKATVTEETPWEDEVFGKYQVQQVNLELKKGVFSGRPTLKIEWNGQYVLLDKEELSFLRDLLTELDDRGNLEFKDCFDYKVSD